MKIKSLLFILITNFLVLAVAFAAPQVLHFTDIDLAQVDFIMPASGLSEAELSLLRQSLPIKPPTNDANKALPYNAASDEARFAQLKSAIYGDKKYIWAVRGGYGSARLFERMTKLTQPATHKIVIGYSDITFLHLFFDKWGWKTIHGTMPADLLHSKNEINYTTLSNILKAKRGVLKYEDIKPLNKLAAMAGPIHGQIIGGNLSIIASSIGTDWQINARGRIILIEEVGDKGYVIDRNLTHLRQSGVLKEAVAILFGTFDKSDDNAKYAMKQFVSDIDIPVYVSELFGHGYNNFPIPFGFPSTIQPDLLTVKYDFT